MTFMLIHEFDVRNRFQIGILGRAMAHHLSPRMAKLIGYAIRLYPRGWVKFITRLVMHGADSFR